MRAIPIAIALALAALFAACGGDSSSTATPTATGSQTIESAVTTTQGPDKTVTPLHETASVAATAPGGTPTAPPVSTNGTPAAIPEDESSFIQTLNGRHTTLSYCTYNPPTDIADCDGVLYSLDPPIVAEGIICTLWHVDDQPYAISCSQAVPQGTHFYEIR
jgi:hypothetical protein